MTPLPPPPKRRLPIGIQTFRHIREDGCYYVDKTGLAIDLIESPGKAFFLSRPRRFGKSLLVDTLKELFEGNQALFTGLAAEMRWDWSQRYPVIRISFGGGVVRQTEELGPRIDDLLAVCAAQHDVTLTRQSLSGRFEELIRLLHAQSGERVVVLIDEYDKPILDNIDRPEMAREMREGLKNLYSVLKDADAHLKFVFLTGVSKFSKVSLFSGLNHLTDITLDPEYSALCGYTDEDLDTVFAPELPGLDRDEIRRWYNGYNWLGESVYNPFDVLLLFRKRRFKPYWFETGTPTFLVKLLTERRQFTPDLGRLMAPETLLSTFDVDTIPTEALMFQAGYLTIASERARPGRTDFQLKYPNQEVQASLNDVLLQSLSGDLSAPGPQISRLWDLLEAGDPLALRELFHAFFASIPNDWYRNSPIAQYEGYWASIFYSHFAALGLDIRVEDTTNKGRIDMVVLTCGAVWIFEFKVVELVPEGKALAQIQAKGYAEKYRDRGEPIHLIGVEFSREARNLAAFEVETLPYMPA
ncbi:ATP-binding protein [Sphaerotilus sp.]|uniref:ATP-binding protein n=1 Tax=Sphaerotilus sp. TaxID=2093942 RepID=UPI002ACD871B|nr:ATP-binding protein [Sphaerotilus sp.]MDZ7858721.1 ATP-binding protein [Sphaerotilus sp.]